MKCTSHINAHVGLDESVGVINDVQYIFIIFYLYVKYEPIIMSNLFLGDIASMAFSHKEIMKPTSKTLFFTLTRSQTSL